MVPWEVGQVGDAHTVLCSDDLMGLGMKQTYRTLDDAVLEEWILETLIT